VLVCVAPGACARATLAEAVLPATRSSWPFITHPRSAQATALAMECVMEIRWRLWVVKVSTLRVVFVMRDGLGWTAGCFCSTPAPTLALLTAALGAPARQIIRASAIRAGLVPTAQLLQDGTVWHLRVVSTAPVGACAQIHRHLLVSATRGGRGCFARGRLWP